MPISVLSAVNLPAQGLRPVGPDAAAHLQTEHSPVKHCNLVSGNSEAEIRAGKFVKKSVVYVGPELETALCFAGRYKRPWKPIRDEIIELFH